MSIARETPDSPILDWAEAFREWAGHRLPTLPGLRTLPDTVCHQLLVDPGVIAGWLDGRVMPPPSVRALGYPAETWRAVQGACEELLATRFAEAWEAWLNRAPVAARRFFSPPRRRLVEAGLAAWWRPTDVFHVIAAAARRPYPLLGALLQATELPVGDLFAVCDALARRVRDGARRPSPDAEDRPRDLGALVAAMAVLERRGQWVLPVADAKGRPGYWLQTAGGLLADRRGADPQAIAVRLVRDWPRILPHAPSEPGQTDRPPRAEIRPRYADWPMALHVVVSRRDDAVWAMPLWLYWARRDATRFAVDRLTAPRLPVPPQWAHAVETAAVDGQPLDPEQREALLRIAAQPLTVVVGPPGTGKTTLGRILAEAARATGWTVVGFAPTGRAARRLQSLTGIRSATVHSALMPRGFVHAGGMARCDIAVVDEASMLDHRTLQAVLRSAEGSAARLVFLGDPDQLPPVERTDVFRGLVAAADGQGRLVRLHRRHRHDEASLNARCLFGEGEAWAWGGKVRRIDLPPVEGDDLPSEWLDAVVAWVRERPGDSWQALAPTRDLAARINAAIRAAVHGEDPGAFLPGDRVMQMENDYRAFDLRNGEQGLVEAVGPDGITARFEDRDAPIVVPEAYARRWAFAWAATVHKAQGGQWDDILIVVPSRLAGQVTREMLYTALTRVGAGTVTILSDDADAVVAAARDNPERMPRAFSYTRYLAGALARRRAEAPPQAGRARRRAVTLCPDPGTAD